MDKYEKELMVKGTLNQIYDYEKNRHGGFHKKFPEDFSKISRHMKRKIAEYFDIPEKELFGVTNFGTLEFLAIKYSKNKFPLEDELDIETNELINLHLNPSSSKEKNYSQGRFGSIAG